MYLHRTKVLEMAFFILVSIFDILKIYPHSFWSKIWNLVKNAALIVSLIKILLQYIRFIFILIIII